MIQYTQLSRHIAYIHQVQCQTNYWIRSQTQKHTLRYDRKEKSRCRILPEAGSCKRKENPVQTPVCACVEPVKMPFCIRDRAHTVRTNTHSFFFFWVCAVNVFSWHWEGPWTTEIHRGERERGLALKFSWVPKKISMFSK